MRHLEFSRKHGKLILEGKKRATFRRRTTAKEGDVLYVHAGGKIIGRAKIRSVELKSVDDITDEDAKMDGFESREELMKEIRNIYGDVDRLYLIKFDFEPIEAQNPYSFHYGDEDLADIARKALERLDLDEREREVLEIFLKSGSIRKTAAKLGGWKMRGEVRKVLRKCLKKLRETDGRGGEDIIPS